MAFSRLRSTSALAAAVALAGWLIAPVSATAAGSNYVIGVDNAAPAGHDWLYVDFFPNHGTNLHKGSVVDFKWNPGSIDGFHTTTLLPGGTSAAPSSLDFIVPDFDDPFLVPGQLPQLQFNPAAVAPTDPTCGNASNPCNFNGGSVLNSGAVPTLPGPDFWVHVNANPGTYTFVCLVHPNMKGTFTVVDDATTASTQQQLNRIAHRQYRSETRAALKEEARVIDNFEQDNGDGTRTVTVTAGTAVPGVEIAEMLPQRVDVRPGDTVTWKTRTIVDVHTVTFPQGHGSDSVDPFQPILESGESFEFHVNPLPRGDTAIATASTIGTSGILANLPPGQPSSYAFSFPNPGTFIYQCRIHDHMIGTIVAKGENEGSG